MSEKFSWYLSRSSGWVAFVLLALTVVWGVLGITRLIERKGLPRWMMELHKYLALLTIVFTGVHLAGLVGDNYMHIGWSEILVPYALDWKPGAVSFGIAAFYLLIAVQMSSWLRSRLPRRLWRTVHLLSYPALWLVAMHGLRAGTDSSNLGVRIGVSAVIGLTSLIVVLRIVKGRTNRRATFTPAATQAAADPVPPEAIIIPGAEQLRQVRAAKAALDEALEALHQARPATQSSAFVDRRHEPRTLVADAPPPT